MDLYLVGTVHRDPKGKQKLFNLLEKMKPGFISIEVSPASIKLRREYGEEWMRLFRKRIEAQSRRTGKRPSELMAGRRLRGVYEYLRLPYEYRACLKYAMQKSAPLFLLDDSDVASSFLARVKNEILSHRNIALLIEADLEESANGGLSAEVDAEYKKAWRQVYGASGRPSSDSRFDWDVWGKREAEIAQKLRLLHQGLTRRKGLKQTPKEFVDGLIIASEAVGHLPELIYDTGLIHVYVGGWEHLVDDGKGMTLYSRLKENNPERLLCRTPE